MPIFEYKAFNSQGKQIKGTVDAESPRAARIRLKQQNIFPTGLTEALEENKKKSINVNISFRSQKVGAANLAIATRQLATLISAGMPLVESLRAAADQIEHAHLKGVFVKVADSVNEGSTLANAMREYEKVFPRLYVNMVSSGEASGSLDLVLDRLSELLESQAALRRKIMAALSYPILMLFLCLGVVILLLAYVVPQITAIFADQGVTLPLPTRIVIVLSSFTQNYWWLCFILLILVVIFCRRYSATEKGREAIDRTALKLPLIGNLILKVATARFARNLGTMLTSGIEVLTALSIAKNIVGNSVLEQIISDAAEGVREGKSLAPELNKRGVFPKMLIHMIAIGEKSGEVDTMLNRAATSYESEVSAFITGLTSILEPVLILLLAGIVGGILASVMLPMIEMTSMATK